MTAGTESDAAWVVGVEPQGDALALVRYPSRCGPTPARVLDYGHIAADMDCAWLSAINRATILYTRPGVVSWNSGPRLPLAARATQMLSRFPDAVIVAAALDDRRCWAQLRDHPPVILALPAPGIDPRLLASLIYYYSIPARNGWTPDDLGETETVVVDGCTIDVEVSRSDPAEDWPTDDALAPRPCTPRRGRDTARVRWSDAEERARDIFLSCRGWVQGPPDAGRMGGLWPLLVYATAVETGRTAEDVTVAQLRYRLGEALWAEDASLALVRCLTWLGKQLQNAGHNARPSTPVGQLWGLLGSQAAAIAELLEHVGDAESPHRDDPVVRAWRDLTIATLEFRSAEEGSDGTTYPASHSWVSQVEYQWPVMVSLIDAELLGRSGGWLCDTAVHIVGRADHDRGRALVESPLWAFDHAARAVVGPPLGYVIGHIVGASFVGSTVSEPVPVEHLRRCDDLG
jgi:hypothetical protein